MGVTRRALTTASAGGLVLGVLAGAGGSGDREPPTTERPAIARELVERRWTASWIACPGAPERDAGVFRFRKVLELGTRPDRFLVHVSADQRFVLFVNGRRVGSGPARGDLDFWRFESLDLARHLQPGRNLLVALVWSFGTLAPAAQVSDRTGFLLQGDGALEQPAHSDASWQCEPEPGHQAWPEGMQALRAEAHQYVVVGPGERLDAARYDWDWARLPEPGEPAARWRAAVAYDQPSPRSIRVGPGYALSPEGRLLVPNELPPMEYREVAAGRPRRSQGVTVPAGFPDREGLTIPPQTTASVLLDRGTLIAAYPELAFSLGRGARLRLSYQEALVADGFRKGHRDEIEGKRLVGYADEVLPDGGRDRVFHPLWWRTWRYLQLDVTTGPEALRLDALRAHATGYPFEAKARLVSGDSRLARIFEVGWRTARLCAHETYVDCPYYEQLQYVGDTRIQALVSYVMTGDDRLARQAISAFERSRRSEGLTSSRYPSGLPQYIPPFSLLWVGMVHDYWRYRDDPAFVRSQLPGTRTVLDWFEDRRAASGLSGRLPWWNFVDWTFEDEGVPPLEPDGQSATITLQLAIALSEAAELEQALGDPRRAEAYRERARAAVAAVQRRCWDDSRGLVADRPARDRFSQQTNILAILAEAVPPGRGDAVLDRVLAAGMPSARDPGGADAARARDLTKASYYFRFYLARAIDKLGRGDEYLPQLEPWREMLDLGLSTWAESPLDSTRSDCHAWSAHPNYDLLTIVAGIRPGTPGFGSVHLTPHLGALDHLEAALPHPRGPIGVSYRRQGTTLDADVVLPPGLGGQLRWRGRSEPLRAGRQSLRLD